MTMISQSRARVTGMLTLICAMGLLSGCSPVMMQPLFPKLRGDRAFIKYWPPPKEDTELRVAVKDNIDMQGVVTTAGSKYFARNAKPAAQDAACLAPVRARGATIVGKTNLNELALGVSGMNAYFGTPRNHLNDEKRLMPGGSSSGSAVAVASGRADVAIATDTAGSIRTPAACNGVFGLKTTYGLIPLKGVYPISPRHLDTVGPIARDVPTLVEGMDLLKPGFTGKYMQAMAAQPTGRSIRVGRLYVEGTDRQIDEAVDRALRAAGFTVVRLGPDFEAAWKDAMSHGNTIAVVDGYEVDKELMGTRGISTTTKAAIVLGNLQHDSHRYDEALAGKAAWQRQLRRVFQKVDFIALPTLKGNPLTVPLVGQFILFEARALAMQNTVAVNYAGVPAVAVPVPMDDKKVPLTSVQLVGPNLSEAKLLNAARILASKR